MKKISKKGFYGSIAIALALLLSVGGAIAFVQTNGEANAEAVTVSESATVVSSPFTDAVAQVKDSVVGVNNYTTVSRSNYYGYNFGFGNSYGDNSGSDNNDNSREVLQSSGSGVVVAEGYVLTNYHVVEDATSLEVTSGDNTYQATVAGYDESLDIAVLKVENLDLTPVTLGDSDVLNVGDWAICIGNPLSFDGTTTVGVISALNREVTTSDTYDQYGLRQDVTNYMIQTDAAINAGNSGGGMFNVAGELIGIPSMKYTGSYYSTTSVEGIGMAIPINVAKPLINDVLAGKTTSSTQSSSSDSNAAISSTDSTAKPRTGISVTNASSISSYAVQEGILPNGVYINEVESGSPAEKAGLQAGDIIVEADGTVITSTSQLQSIINAKSVGDTVQLKVYRIEGITEAQTVDDLGDGTYMEFTVEVAILDNVKQ